MCIFPAHLRKNYKYTNPSCCAQHGCGQHIVHVDFLGVFGAVHHSNVCMAANAAETACETH